MARVRPKERDGIVNVLLTGVPGAERTEDMVAEATEMATDILLVIEEQRASRPDWFIIKRDPGVGVTLHGPYVTKNAAHKEIEKGDLVAASPGATALIVQRINSIDEGVLPL